MSDQPPSQSRLPAWAPSSFRGITINPEYAAHDDPYWKGLAADVNPAAVQQYGELQPTNPSDPDFWSHPSIRNMEGAQEGQRQWSEECRRQGLPDPLPMQRSVEVELRRLDTARQSLIDHSTTDPARAEPSSRGRPSRPQYAQKQPRSVPLSVEDEDNQEDEDYTQSSSHIGPTGGSRTRSTRASSRAQGTDSADSAPSQPAPLQQPQQAHAPPPPQVSNLVPLLPQHPVHPPIPAALQGNVLIDGTPAPQFDTTPIRGDQIEAFPHSRPPYYNNYGTPTHIRPQNVGVNVDLKQNPWASDRGLPPTLSNGTQLDHAVWMQAYAAAMERFGKHYAKQVNDHNELSMLKERDRKSGWVRWVAIKTLMSQNTGSGRYTTYAGLLPPNYTEAPPF